MGSSGFPFPSVLCDYIQLSEDEISPVIARAGSSCSPMVLSPGMSKVQSPLAGTPNHVREQEILPSVISPIITSVEDLKRPVMNHSAVKCSRSSQMVSRILEVEDGSGSSSPLPSNPRLPTPPHEKHPSFRLPSFYDLGIASYHRTTPSGDNTIGSLPIDMAMVTPSTDPSDRVWGSSSGDLVLVGGGAPANIEGGGSDEPAALARPVQTVSSILTDCEEASEFLKDAIKKILDKLNGLDAKPTSIKILSHALPSPTVPGHLFPQILESVKQHNSSSSLVWISHLHAVPYRFNVSDLPTSPLSTPGQPLGTSDGTGEDYFTVKTFESAVEAMDYSSFSEGLSVRTAGSPSRSSFQQELAAPSSLNLIVVERYIPPLSTKEFFNLFSLTKPSLLADRLFELVPGHGCLVFIYPTRTGAQTFCEKLLGPIIDPLLRGLAIVNGFSADLSKAIGTMTAVPHMYEFESLKFHMNVLCEEIRQSGSSSPIRQRLCGDSDKFSVIYAEKKDVSMAREVWSDWWVKQEKVRVRRAVSQYFRFGNRVTSDSESHVTQEIFNGISTRPHPAGSGSVADSKVEVGIFVISRGR